MFVLRLAAISITILGVFKATIVPPIDPGIENWRLLCPWPRPFALRQFIATSTRKKTKQYAAKRFYSELAMIRRQKKGTTRRSEG